MYVSTWAVHMWADPCRCPTCILTPISLIKQIVAPTPDPEALAMAMAMAIAMARPWPWPWP